MRKSIVTITFTLKSFFSLRMFLVFKKRYLKIDLSNRYEIFRACCCQLALCFKQGNFEKNAFYGSYEVKCALNFFSQINTESLFFIIS